VNDLSASANYVMARIAVGKNPRGVAMSPDGRRLYVANRMDDSLSVIDTVSNKSVRTIDLGGAEDTSLGCGAGSRSSPRRAMHFRVSSAVRTATSIRRSTG
jgi:YVTN family beta-propeller protein